MAAYKILVVTSLFPNKFEPTRGIFTKQTLDNLRSYCQFDLVVPIPWFPRTPWIRKYYRERYKRNFGVDIVPEEINTEQGNGYTVYHPKYFSIPVIGVLLNDFFYYLALKKVTKGMCFNAIMGFWLYPDCFAAALLARDRKVPLVSVGLGSDINVLTKSWALRSKIKFALTQTSRIILVSHALKDRLLQLGLVAIEKITVIINGVDIEKFKPMDKNECRRKVGLPVDASIILFIGNLIEIKGIDILIDSYISLYGSCFSKKLSLIIIGEGMLRSVLEEKIRKKLPANSVKFVGRQPHEKLPLWMNSADALCLPSRNEGCPNVLLEAKACGIPLVASDVGEVSRIVTDNTGIIVLPGNIEGLRQALEKVLSKDWGSYSLMKRTWKDTAKEYFSEIDKAMAKVSI